MSGFIDKMLKYRRFVIVFFAILAIICIMLSSGVSVNYTMSDYLPDSAKSTIALNTMSEEYDSDVPNARIMIEDVTLVEALAFKEELENVDGVESVTWLDDSQNMAQPIETMDQDAVETYYQDGNALYTVTLNTEKQIYAVAQIKELTDKELSMTGDAISTVASTEATESEIKIVMVMAVIVIVVILVLTTTSYIEPIIFLLSIGIAILINRGTNIIFGEISFVSNAAGPILQLAVSMDYSIFLMDRFNTYLIDYDSPEIAMCQAMIKSFSSISASALTTIIGFAALLLMEFKLGQDLGLVMSKAICISLITVFTFLPCLIVELHEWILKYEHRGFIPSFEKFSNLVTKVKYPMIVIFLILAIPSYFLKNQNTFYYGSSHILGEGTNYYEETQKIEDIFGKSNQMVLMLPLDSTAKEVELSHSLRQLSYVKDIVSYVDSAGASIPKEYLDENTLSQLDSDHYTRFVITVTTDYEGDEAFHAVNEIEKIAASYYDDYLLAGNVPSSYDMKDITTSDMSRVNTVAIVAVFIVIVLTTRTVLLPLILVFIIEGAIWVNLAMSALTGSSMFYISYLIISSIQLGATVDYAISLSDRYLEARKTREKGKALAHTMHYGSLSILTSGSILTIAGLILGISSTHGVLKELGMLLFKGTLLSMIFVLFALPGFMFLLDKWIMKYRFSRDRKEFIGYEK